MRAAKLATTGVVLLIAVSIVFGAAPATTAPSEIPSDEEIRTILKNFIERDHWGVGIVVGIIDPNGQRIVSYGRVDNGDSPPVNGDTLFEIGSVTKTFTTLLLETMIERGQMSLADPLEKFLPASFTASDPAPGIKKRLRVEYLLQGAGKREEVEEGQALELPAGVQVTRALYGDLSARKRTADVTLRIAELATKGGEAVKIPAGNALAERERPLKVPSRGRKITLLDLATHTSGLPREANGDLYEGLSRCRLEHKPGGKPSYSNFGLSLLGRAIELKAGTNYETLLRERICDVLKMDSTCITPSAEQRLRLARSHNQENRLAGDLADYLASAPGAGAIRSTAKDMLQYLAANIGLEESPLTPLMARTHRVQVRRAFGGADLALPWWVHHWNGAEQVTHGGSTWGHQAFVGFDKKLKRGVVVLSNREDRMEQAVGRLGMYLLAPPPNEIADVPVSPEVLAGYTGLYTFRVWPDATVSIRPGGDRLILQFLSSAANEWLPVSETEFVDAWGSGARLRMHRGIFGPMIAEFTRRDGTRLRGVRIYQRVPDDLFRPVPEPLKADSWVERDDSVLQGMWNGTARVWYWPFASLKGKLRIAEHTPGTFQAEFDLPELGLEGLPASVYYAPPQVDLIVRSGAGIFKGKIDAAHSKITGHFIAGGRRIGTTLRRAE